MHSHMFVLLDALHGQGTARLLLGSAGRFTLAAIDKGHVVPLVC